MELTRKPTASEEKLISFLMTLSKTRVENNTKTLNVIDLNDDGMGSLRIIPYEVDNGSDRIIGEMVSEYEFKDTDEVSVLASLYLDVESNLYELNLWKVDFSSIIELPAKFW